MVTSLGTIVWDTSWVLSDRSLVGRALHTLIGYSDQPTAMQLAVYLATLAVTFALMRLFAAARPARVVIRENLATRTSTRPR